MKFNRSGFTSSYKAAEVAHVVERGKTSHGSILEY